MSELFMFSMLVMGTYLLLVGLDRALRPIRKPPTVFPLGFPDAFGHGYEVPGLVSGTGICLPGGKIISCSPDDPRLTVSPRRIMR